MGVDTVAGMLDGALLQEVITPLEVESPMCTFSCEEQFTMQCAHRQGGQRQRDALLEGDLLAASGP